MFEKDPLSGDENPEGIAERLGVEVQTHLFGPGVHLVGVESKGGHVIPIVRVECIDPAEIVHLKPANRAGFVEYMRTHEWPCEKMGIFGEWVLAARIDKKYIPDIIVAMYNH